MQVLAVGNMWTFPLVPCLLLFSKNPYWKVPFLISILIEKQNWNKNQLLIFFRIEFSETFIRRLFQLCFSCPRYCSLPSPPFFSSRSDFQKMCVIFKKKIRLWRCYEEPFSVKFQVNVSRYVHIKKTKMKNELNLQ